MATYPVDRFDSEVCRLRFDTGLGIIETHQHLSEPDAEDRTFGWGNNDIRAILRAMDHCGVEAAILQPLGGANDPVRVHRMIHEHGQEHPGRIFGIASLNVKEYGPEKTARELRNCVEQLGFVGIKFHGFSHGINPLSPLAQVYIQAAIDLDVPLMVCVGAHGQPFTNPDLFVDAAARHPDLTLVFAHMDYVVAESVIAAAARRENLYLSTSLSITAYLERALSTVGPERVVLASEDAAAIPGEIAKTVFASHNDEELRAVFRTTPIDLFKLGGRLASDGEG